MSENDKKQNQPQDQQRAESQVTEQAPREAEAANQEVGDGQVAALRAELEEVKDRSLRCQAELENYRKRVARQMEEERRYASIGLIRDLLPVWDNVRRAIEAAEKTRDVDSLVAGFKMVAEQFVQALDRHHCTQIPALHQPFDPHVHQAISQMPSEEPAGTVVAVTQEGFMLHDRVVRPSQVVVSAGPPEKAETGAEAEEAEKHQEQTGPEEKEQ